MNLQKSFLDELKKTSRRGNSFVDEIASILQLSTDSTYRRIRGETVLSLEEVQKLCTHFHFSLDALLSPAPGRVVFRHRSINLHDYTVLDWIKNLRKNLALMRDAAQKQILHSGKDIPLLYYFKSPEMAAFKMYFWMKSMFFYPQYQTVKFKRTLIPQEYLDVASDVWSNYSQIDSTEIWTEDCVNVTLNQIESYHRSGFFQTPTDALDLCDIFRALLVEVRGWAAGEKKDGRIGKLQLFKNEILFADNTVLFKVNNRRIVFIPHSMIEVISTTQEPYCQQVEKDMRSYIDRSVLISTTGEKERNKFFNSMDAKINSAKERMVRGQA